MYKVKDKKFKSLEKARKYGRKLIFEGAKEISLLKNGELFILFFSTGEEVREILYTPIKRLTRPQLP